MRFGDQDMQGREPHRLVDRPNLVAETERGDARSPDKLGLHHAIYGAVVQQAEAVVDGRRTDQDDLAVPYPIPSSLIELVCGVAGGPAQRRAGNLLIAKCLDS